MTSYLVIFGAAVLDNGQPSGTLRRRVQAALALADKRPDTKFMPTGGAGANGFVEAQVMKDMLIAAGAPPERLAVEPSGRDTLDSVFRCDALLRAAGDADVVTPCTSLYHVPRCALLLRMSGWRVKLEPMPHDLGQLSPWKLGWSYLREIPAIFYDAALMALSLYRRAR